MKEKWLQLKSRYESFAIRERCLMVGAVAAVVYLLWDFVVLQPMAGEMKILVARERVANQALQTGEAEVNVLTAIAKKDPNIELKRNLQELQEKLRQLDSQLDTLSAGLVAAEKLPKVLHFVLQKSDVALISGVVQVSGVAVRPSGGLTIASMATLPPEEVLLSKEKTVAAVSTSEADPAAAPALETVKIYKHGVNLKLAGDFVSAVRYLQALEQSEWRFYWESLKYQVSSYPRAEIHLKVFTLSSQRGIFDAP
jgi:MSHA biogenesis protein MshJ